MRFFDPQSRQSLIPKDNRDEMNWQTIARYKKKERRKKQNLLNTS